jgi:hypothetical protein
MFHSYWLATCKLMQILFRIQLTTVMRIRIRDFFDADADPGYQNDVDPCGSGSTTLLLRYIALSRVAGVVIKFYFFYFSICFIYYAGYKVRKLCAFSPCRVTFNILIGSFVSPGSSHVGIIFAKM